ncbi:MAG: GTP-binding protein [archaeon]|nr:GTP-binding protein [archaeon]
MTSNKSESEYFSIVILGDEGVGKTSILDRYCNSKFSFTQSKHKTAEVFKKNIQIKDKEYLIKLWDSHCNEKLNKQIYKKADCIIIVCSVLSRDSYDNIDNWIQLVSDNTDIANKMMVLMANKIDIEEERVVNSEEINQKGGYYQMDTFEVSAMESTGIDESFEKIIEKIIININKEGGKKGTELGKDEIYSSKCVK